MVSLPDGDERKLLGPRRQHGGALQELPAGKADDGLAGQRAGYELRLPSAVVLHEHAAASRRVLPRGQRPTSAGPGRVGSRVVGVQVEDESARRQRLIVRGGRDAKAPFSSQAVLDPRPLSFGDDAVVDEDLGDLAFEEFEVVVFRPDAEPRIADVLEAAIDPPAVLMPVVERGHQSIRVERERRDGELAGPVGGQIVLVVALAVEAVAPARAELAEGPTLDCVRAPDVVERAVAPVEDVGVLIARVVAAQ
jgi:hypothetical protein